MNCNEVEKMIIAGSIDTAAREHISHCASCRDFAGFCAMTMAEPEFDDSMIPSLHSIVRTAAARKRSKFKIITASVTSGIAACAAMGVFILVMQYWKLPEAPNAPESFTRPQANTAAAVTTIDLEWHEGITMSWDDSMTEDMRYILADAASPWHIEAYNPFILED